MTECLDMEKSIINKHKKQRRNVNNEKARESHPPVRSRPKVSGNSDTAGRQPLRKMMFCKKLKKIMIFHIPKEKEVDDEDEGGKKNPVGRVKS